VHTFIYFCLLALVVPSIALSHGTGASFEQEVGEFRIDVGYEPAELRAGDKLVLDFDVLGAGGSSVPFDSVWVRLEREDRTLLATGVARPRIGPTTLLLTLPEEPGEAVLSTRFERAGETLAEASFPFVVHAGEGEADSLPAWLLPSLVALLAGFVFGRLSTRRL